MLFSRKGVSFCSDRHFWKQDIWTRHRLSVGTWKKLDSNGGYCGVQSRTHCLKIMEDLMHPRLWFPDADEDDSRHLRGANDKQSQEDWLLCTSSIHWVVCFANTSPFLKQTQIKRRMFESGNLHLRERQKQLQEYLLWSWSSLFSKLWVNFIAASRISWSQSRSTNLLTYRWKSDKCSTHFYVSWGTSILYRRQ